MGLKKCNCLQDYNLIIEVNNLTSGLSSLCCRRQKHLCPGKSFYRALLDTVELSNSSVTFQIINEECKVGGCL